MEIELATNPVNLITNPMTKEEAECLQTIYDMVDGDVTLKSLRQYGQEDLLLMSIRSYQCHAPSVFRVLKYFHLYATESYPDLFSTVNLKKLKPVLDKKIFALVQTDSDDCPGIMVYRIKRWNPSQVTPDEVIAAAMVYMLQLARISRGAQKNGVIVVVDTEAFSFAHARNSNLSLTRKLMHCLCFASPIRMVGYIVFNSHYLFEKIYAVVKYAIPEKLRKEIFIVKKGSALTALHNKVPDKNQLPLSLGGRLSDEDGFYEGVEDGAMRDTVLQDFIANIQREAKKKAIA